jgi:hypothetical protein
LSQRNDEGHWERTAHETFKHAEGGATALALLSLIYAGEDPRQEPARRSLEWLAAQKLSGTYAYGLRAQVLAKVPGRLYATRLREDVTWLRESMASEGMPFPGSYVYTKHPRGRTHDRYDNSCSQYAVLGVWMAAEAGMRVPMAYWERIGQHWVAVQGDDGGWGYESRRLEIKPPSTHSMTAAGLASVFIVLDQRFARRPNAGKGLVEAIERGLAWFEREAMRANPRAQWHYYYLYGLERVGRACGYKYFGDYDWFREGARWLLENQLPDGSWRGGGAQSLYNTSWALLFLCHGRAPLLFNKLQHGADWNDRLRDVAGLTRFTGHTYERLINWQIVRLDNPIGDLLEAPVLYVYGESERAFSDEEVGRIRDYCRRGGLVFAVAGNGGEAFVRAMTGLARRALPEHSLRPLPRNHPLFSGEVSFPIEDPPEVLACGNGRRLMMLICKRDLADGWSTYSVNGGDEQDLAFGANVYLYATDKTTVRSRLTTPEIPLRAVDTRRTIRVARIWHAGEWDVEPYGWQRLSRYMHNETGSRLQVVSGVRLDSEAIADFSAAHITGSGELRLSAAERKGLRRFLTGGGTLIADGAGGSRVFATSLERELRSVLPDAPRLLSRRSPLLTGEDLADAVDLSPAAYRRRSRGSVQDSPYPALRVITSLGRHAVIYTPLDISTGLLGTHVYDLEGFAPRSALEVMRNLLLYANLSTTEKVRVSRWGGRESQRDGESRGR